MRNARLREERVRWDTNLADTIRWMEFMDIDMDANNKSMDRIESFAD